MLTIQPQRLDLQPGHLVVDLGCGQGRHVQALAWEYPVRVVGMDLDPRAVATTRDGLLQLMSPDDPRLGRCLPAVGDCLRLPLPADSVDHLICSEVLEHVPDYHRVLQEIHRVLKPGGGLAVSVPAFWPERLCWRLSREYQHDPGGHVRIFQATALRLEIQRLGFTYHGSHRAHALHTPYWWLKCLRWDQRETWRPIHLYHRLLVWDILKNPRLTRGAEKVLNPILGKSVALYFTSN